VLKLAALLCVIVGAIHSLAGERYLIAPLLKGDRVPHLFGNDFFPKRTIRFAWHITTVAWLGMAYILLAISNGTENLAQLVLNSFGAVFLVSGMLSFGFTRGKHLSWIAFWVMAALCFLAAAG
jgi:hypothetical protein